MIADFDWTSWYGLVIAVAGAYLFWAAVFSTGRGHVRAIKARLSPPPPTAPVIVLGGPSYHYSLLPLHERGEDQQDELVVLCAEKDDAKFERAACR